MTKGLARDCRGFTKEAQCHADYCMWTTEIQKCGYKVDCAADAFNTKELCEGSGDPACQWKDSASACVRVECVLGWDGDPRIRATVGYYTVPEVAAREHRYGQEPCDAAHVCVNGLRLTRVHWTGGSDGGKPFLVASDE